MSSRSFTICLLIICQLGFGLFGCSEAPFGPDYGDEVEWIGAFYVKGKVGLKWKTFEGATTYNIYRKAADTEYAKIATAVKNQHFDTELSPGSEYTYKIAAVGADGTETFSSEISVTIPVLAACRFDSLSCPNYRQPKVG